MSRLCKICTLPPARRNRIDTALVDGITYKRIAERYSTKMQPINTVNLCNHRRHLLPKDVVRARPGRPSPEVATTLLERVENLVAESRTIAESAKDAQQWMAACSALREVRCCIELLGKLTGEITGTNFNFNNINFANLSPEQAAAFLDAAAKRGDARVRALIAERMGPPTPEIAIRFVGVVDSCPKCGYEHYGSTPAPVEPPLLEAPTNGNGTGV